MSLKLKVDAMCGDPKILVDLMKFYLGIEDVNTKDDTLEGSKLFGSIKHKLNVPPGVHCNSHQPDKTNNSIPHPNTQATHRLIEESLNFVEHGVVHTTSMLERDFFASKWHILGLSPTVGTSKHGTHAPTYKGLKKKFRSTNNVEYEFWFFMTILNNV